MIESLVVLSIFMVLTTATVISLKPQHSVLNDEAFLTQLKADLFFAQAYAISHQQEVSVVFSPSNHSYSLLLRSGQDHLLDRSYSTDIELIEGTITLYFKYLHDGTVNKFGTFLIISRDKTYMMTILIGKGRFYVTEQ
ncbi:type II secretion system protein [Neobacillus niacini]|nr:type II secretion system protein [Neobacillus niacini]